MSIPRVARCRHLASSLLFFTLASTALANGPAPDTGKAQTAVATQPAAPAPASSNNQHSYPQIVHISLLQGDVRVARGEKNAIWEKATTNLPLETGFNLVTGNDGRVEIEFEDTSTVYLGENSVLGFNDLSTTGGIPHTDLTLLAGTLTIRLQPTMPTERYVLRTLTHHFAIQYPRRPFARINSYLDAMTITAESDADFHLQGVPGTANRKGETATFRSGHLESVTTSAEDAKAFADWDNWVNQRVAARDAAQATMLKEANLPAAVPGLAEMQGQGHFFPCAPYGTCWEPTHGWSGAQPGSDGPDTDTPQAASGRFDKPFGSRTVAAFLPVVQVSGGSPALEERQILDEDLFPCSPFQVRRLITTDLATGKRKTTDLGMVPGNAPYMWAVCHTGSWIRRQHRYVWVAGTKRHHRCPVHWVKYGKVRGFVPIHPRDVAGTPPLNLQHGVFVPEKKQGGMLGWVAFERSTSVKLLGGPPKEFEGTYRPALQRADEPRLEAHLASDGMGVENRAGLRSMSTPITFDHKSHSFVLARQVTQGGKTVTLTEHFGSGRVGGATHVGGGSSFGRSSVSGGSSHVGGGDGASRSGGGFGGGGHASGGAPSSAGAASGGSHK